MLIEVMLNLVDQLWNEPKWGKWVEDSDLLVLRRFDDVHGFEYAGHHGVAPPTSGVHRRLGTIVFLYQYRVPDPAANTQTGLLYYLVISPGLVYISASTGFQIQGYTTWIIWSSLAFSVLYHCMSAIPV